ncbi:hypothetical protein M1D97_00420 [Kushneria sp. AK178]
MSDWMTEKNLHHDDGIIDGTGDEAGTVDRATARQASRPEPGSAESVDDRVSAAISFFHQN